MQICWCCLATKTLNLNNRDAVWQLVARPTTAFPKQNNNLLGVNSTYVRMCVCVFWGCICLFSVLSIVKFYWVVRWVISHISLTVCLWKHRSSVVKSLSNRVISQHCCFVNCKYNFIEQFWVVSHTNSMSHTRVLGRRLGWGWMRCLLIHGISTLVMIFETQQQFCEITQQQ